MQRSPIDIGLPCEPSFILQLRGAGIRGAVVFNNRSHEAVDWASFKLFSGIGIEFATTPVGYAFRRVDAIFFQMIPDDWKSAGNYGGKSARIRAKPFCCNVLRHVCIAT
jgi:hypothetical protein